MKLATMGRGFVVDRAIDALRDVPDLQLKAVYSRNERDAREFARKHGIEKSYSHMDDLFSDPDIDVVYIALPNALHYPTAKKALQAGKHVILEKPFVSSTKQANELFDLAEKEGLMLFEAITTTHTDNFQILKDQLAKAGDFHQVFLNFTRYNPRYALYKNGEITSTLSKEMDGGALMDVGIYNIQLALGLFGRPEWIQYLPNYGPDGLDTSGLLLMGYPGFTISSSAGMDSNAPYLSILSGEKGTFTIDQGSVGQMNRVQFAPIDDPANPQTISQTHRNHMSFELQDFADAIQNRDWKAYHDWKKQTLMAQEILDEARKQREEGFQRRNHAKL